jgi:hypothetical protein
LGSVVQLSLFDTPDSASPIATDSPRHQQLDTTVDRIRAKFGGDSLVRASTL